jgi:hypothetical protein
VHTGPGTVGLCYFPVQPQAQAVSQGEGRV